MIEENLDNSKLEDIREQLDIKEISSATKSIIKKQKTKKTFSLEKILSDVSKYFITKAVKINQDELCDYALEEIANEVESLYSSGIEALLERHNDISKDIKSTYMAFFIDCSAEFRKKYSFYDRINLAVSHFENSLIHNLDTHFYNSNTAKIDYKDDLDATYNLNNNVENNNVNMKSNETESIHARRKKYMKNENSRPETNDNDDSYDEEEIREKEWSVTKKILSEKMKESLKNQHLLFRIFENFEVQEKILLNKLISRRIVKNSKEYRERKPKNYYCNNFVLDTLGYMYYEFNFEDVLIILVRLLSFMTELDITLKFTEDLNLLMCFYAKEETIELLAQKYQYDMQLKNYGAYYLGLENKYRAEMGYPPVDIEHMNDENTKLLIQNHVEKDNLDDLSNYLPQLYDLDEESVINFPPYICFDVEKKTKFMRYSKNDLYHVCQFDPELRCTDDIMFEKDDIDSKSNMSFVQKKFLKTLKNFNKGDNKDNDNSLMDNSNNNIQGVNNKDKDATNQEDEKNSQGIVSKMIKDPVCCSKFRSIDRLRLIYRVIDSNINFRELIKAGIFKSHLFKRRKKNFGDELSFKKLCIYPLNILSLIAQTKFINFIRNFYGEKISFYFLFCHTLTLWMLCPAILGIIFFVFSLVYNNKNEDELGLLSVSINVSDVIKLVFCGLITVWATLFINYWAQVEVKYSYYWGTDNYESQEPERENFVPDKKERFIFDQKIAKSDHVKIFFKTLLSYTIIVALIALTLFLNYLLFVFKASKAEGADSYYWQLVIGALNSLVIKVMSFIYKLITTWSTEWENYSTQTKYENALCLKFIFFEFINNYFSLIYIAFFKENIEGCTKNNCSQELSIQIYMVLLTNIGINLVELGLPYFIMLYKRHIYVKKTTLLNGGNKVSCKPFSVEYQNLCEEYNTTMSDYIEIIILFGYVSLFSVACPLTPVIVMMILYIEKFVDSCKLLFLSRVTLLSRADGIEVFRIIFKIIYFIGMITSIALVLFTQQTANKYSLVAKIVIFAAVENLILIMMMTFKFNHLPEWFDYTNLIKTLYLRKFVSKPSEHLPHHFLKGDKSMDFLKARVEEELNEINNAKKNNSNEIDMIDSDDNSFRLYNNKNKGKEIIKKKTTIK